MSNAIAKNKIISKNINDIEGNHQCHRINKKLIALRHTNDVMVNGVYAVLIPGHPQIYAYTRTLGEKQLLILCNDCDANTAIPAEIQEKIRAAKGILIQNYKDTDASILRPYEAAVYEIG